jgi:hypothetical protein
MESAWDPMVLGPVMIAITVTWFSWMFWDGMRPEDAPRRTTHRWQPGEPGPWWTNPGFDVPEPIRIPAEWDERRSQTARTRADIVEVWGRDSFPASDPPANW